MENETSRPDESRPLTLYEVRLNKISNYKPIAK